MKMAELSARPKVIEPIASHAILNSDKTESEGTE